MYDIIIIGAGVSGLACALHLDKNLNVALIEKNEQIGKKLSLTGNGRCNITNSSYGDEFYSNIYNYKFLYSAFSNFDNYSIMELMQKYNIDLVEEEHGRMFPATHKASTIIEAISKNIEHIDLKLNEEVLEVTKENIFTVKTNTGTYHCNKLVIATGGLSYPQTGSDGFGITVAKNFKHNVTKLIASEAPLYSNDNICTDLQGVTLTNAAIKYNGKSYSGYNLLFTHFGLSGPLALRQCFNIISKSINQILIDFIPSASEDYLREQLLNNNFDILKQYIPKSVVKYFLDLHEIDKNSNNSKKKINALVNDFKNYKITLSKYADVSKGFTTAGGVETKQLNNKTFESKIVDNLYFIGEVIDVHAHTGGYNITAFFSTGYNCAINI